VSGPRRLSKRDAETLMADYEHDPKAALAAALAVVTGDSSGGFAERIDRCDLEPERKRLLLDGDAESLDELAQELNELRTVPLAPMVVDRSIGIT
jgi:hypothetical protein